MAEGRRGEAKPGSPWETEFADPTITRPIEFEDPPPPKAEPVRAPAPPPPVPAPAAPPVVVAPPPPAPSRAGRSPALWFTLGLVVGAALTSCAGSVVAFAAWLVSG